MNNKNVKKHNRNAEWVELVLINNKKDIVV